MSDDISNRISRFYTALGKAIIKDMNQLQAKVVENENIKGFFQDFSGGRSQEDLANELHSVIALIGSLEYHLINWANQNNKDPELIKTAFKSPALSMMHDLWNTEKHGYPLQRERTKKSPRLINIRRVMELTTQAKAGSMVMMVAGRNGVPIIRGDGFASGRLTGDIVDKDGNALGDAHKFLDASILEIENVMLSLGIQF